MIVDKPLNESCLEGKAEGRHGAHDHDTYNSVALVRTESIGNRKVKLIDLLLFAFFLENTHHNNGQQDGPHANELRHGELLIVDEPVEESDHSTGEGHHSCRDALIHVVFQSYLERDQQKGRPGKL